MAAVQLSERAADECRLAHLTHGAVAEKLRAAPIVLLPTGSTEQHGPMGLIGTDAFCAEAIAVAAARATGVLVAPTLALTPAPFNMGFAGTISISPALFGALVGEVVGSLAAHGVRAVLAINGHGANLEPVRTVAANTPIPLGISSWWDGPAVNAIRTRHFGAWEGMHATPSEIALTMAMFGEWAVPDAARTPPEKLTPQFIAAHAGDRHGPPDEHRAQFPDGRVGSHSALATAALGAALMEAAAADMAAAIRRFARDNAVTLPR
ncbi:creatininase family protein [Acuticoccus sp. MNP-M23]|uniref:creatininase family protein n=1 Tax=Acuticoccus sp. MNP-M23 TaxID=3072793 RepID=UPI002814BCCB|nr:creatininase family protein [Acuticoccus sp. MNP-M23]WMS44696.1 creatininase family protein [Acuticoccus sp. MNP-M23]